MDLIYLDDDKQDQIFWKLFTAQTYEISQPYVPQDQDLSFIQLADGCTLTPDECVWTRPKQPSGKPKGRDFSVGNEGNESDGSEYGKHKLETQDAAPTDEEGMEDSCEMEQIREGEIDNEAQEIADTIRDLNNSDDNPDNNEFGAFVIELLDGSIVSAFPTEGTTGTVSLRAMLNDAIAQFGSGITGSNIVGIVHSHPSGIGPGFVNVGDINDLSDLDYGNLMPSHPNIGGMGGQSFDWAAGESFLLNNGRSSVDDVSQYILGPDGNLRKCSYADPHPAEEMQQQDAINEAEQDASGQCTN